MSPQSTLETWKAKRRHKLLLTRVLVAIIAACLGATLAGWIASSSAQAASPPEALIAQASEGMSLQQCVKPTCGNQVCETGSTRYCAPWETCSSCERDCGRCTPTPPPQNLCGNNRCDSTETCDTCAVDCGTCTPPPDACDVDNAVCGDGVCAWTDCEGTWNCAQDCTACGDNICNTILGDCAADCPDLQPTTAVPGRSTDTPTPTATATMTATATRTRTPRPSDTPEATDTERPATSEPAAEEPECGLVAYESQPAGWRESYGSASKPGEFVPNEVQNREVWVCPVPPAGERLCIPTYGNLLDAVEDDPQNVRLADCDENGNCTVFDQPAIESGGQMCFVMGAQGTNPTCEIGCALLPNLPNTPFPWWILLLVLLLLLILLIILMQRRRRDDDDESDDMAGLTSGGGAGAAAMRFESMTPPPSPPQTSDQETLINPGRGSDDDAGTTEVPKA